LEETKELSSPSTIDESKDHEEYLILLGKNKKIGKV
jgi:hypothetical protein